MGIEVGTGFHRCCSRAFSAAGAAGPMSHGLLKRNCSCSAAAVASVGCALPLLGRIEWPREAAAPAIRWPSLQGTLAPRRWLQLRMEGAAASSAQMEGDRVRSACRQLCIPVLFARCVLLAVHVMLSSRCSIEEQSPVHERTAGPENSGLRLAQKPQGTQVNDEELSHRGGGCAAAGGVSSDRRPAAAASSRNRRVDIRASVFAISARTASLSRSSATLSSAVNAGGFQTPMRCCTRFSTMTASSASPFDRSESANPIAKASGTIKIALPKKPGAICAADPADIIASVLLGADLSAAFAR